MVPTIHQALARHRSAAAQTVLANVMTGRRSPLAVARTPQAPAPLLVVHRRRTVHPVAHKRAVAALDNGLAGTLHKVEQVVDVVHRQ